MDDVRGLDTYILADSQLNYQFDVRLPCSEPSGLFDGAAESVWDVRTWHTLATGTVATRDYNYRTASTLMDATVSVRNDAVTTGEHYRYAAPYRDAGDDTSPEPETESIAFLATSIKPKHSSVIFSLVIIFMLYSWYGTNPLRVMLIFCSSLSACSIIIFAKKILKRKIR
jgi:type VI secretion system secreted protein VgrG